MKKTQGQRDIERDIKEALRTENYGLLQASTRKLYRHLNMSQKAEVRKNIEPGANPAEVYGRELADSILRKQSKLQNEGKKALAKADTYDEERAIRSRMKISSKDITHLKDNIESVKTSERRGAEVMMKSFYKDDAYTKFMKSAYGKGNKRSTSRMMGEKISYKGGNKKEGYIYHIKVGNKVFEVQTPGYDENKGRLHGFQYREVGSTEWIGG